MRILALSALALTSLTSACGFTPLYGEYAGSPARYDIAVEEIQGQTGYALRDQLVTRFDGAEKDAVAANLKVTVAEANQRLGFALNDRATRSDLTLSATYEFTRGNNKAPIVGQVSTVVTFGIPESPYAEIAALEDARARATSDLADRIARDLALKLAANP